MGDPVMGDPVMGDLVMGDPVMGNLVMGNLVMGDPVMGDVDSSERMEEATTLAMSGLLSLGTEPLFMGEYVVE